VLAADSVGNLYGETRGGETVFVLPVSSDYSTETTLYTFNFNVGADPYVPTGGVTITPRDFVVGTTEFGGALDDGTIFNLGKIPDTTLTVRHAFYSRTMSPTDGAYPGSGLTPGLSHLYYGTAVSGGAGGPNSNGNGIVFEVSAEAADPHYRVIHRFINDGDGVAPTNARLAVDSQGRLYGTTTIGGTENLGAVFMLQKVDGHWQEQVIHSFQISGDLQNPVANVVVDTHGNLYGCAQGGAYFQGGVFRLTPPVEGGNTWQETILYSFGSQPNDPDAAGGYVSKGEFHRGSQGCGITIDPATGTIVGTSYEGGTDGRGTIFVLTPPPLGQSAWTETVGYSFSKNDPAGYHPVFSPLQIGSVYYGATSTIASIFAFTP
jgi:hypothetical protein